MYYQRDKVMNWKRLKDLYEAQQEELRAIDEAENQEIGWIPNELSRAEKRARCDAILEKYRKPWKEMRARHEDQMIQEILAMGLLSDAPAIHFQKLKDRIAWLETALSEKAEAQQTAEL